MRDDSAAVMRLDNDVPSIAAVVVPAIFLSALLRDALPFAFFISLKVVGPLFVIVACHSILLKGINRWPVIVTRYDKTHRAILESH